MLSGYVRCLLEFRISAESFYYGVNGREVKYSYYYSINDN